MCWSSVPRSCPCARKSSADGATSMIHDAGNPRRHVMTTTLDGRTALVTGAGSACVISGSISHSARCQPVGATACQPRRADVASGAGGQARRRRDRSWEPGGEPSAADMGPRGTCCTVRFRLFTRNLASPSHILRREGSRSHRGGIAEPIPSLPPPPDPTRLLCQITSTSPLRAKRWSSREAHRRLPLSQQMSASGRRSCVLPGPR
jgi:hypothetical protein